MYFFTVPVEVLFVQSVTICYCCPLLFTLFILFIVHYCSFGTIYCAHITVHSSRFTAYSSRFTSFIVLLFISFQTLRCAGGNTPDSC
uniref:Uncharacterized protein n=1 Tax=Arundo donax TaxID=35708 RepID=A0A0A9BZJ1_ARUDO